MTIREALIKHLPEDIAEIAIQRTIELNDEVDDFINYPMIFFPSHDVLAGAFKWELTPEGREYWELIDKIIVQNNKSLEDE